MPLPMHMSSSVRKMIHSRRLSSAAKLIGVYIADATSLGAPFYSSQRDFAYLLGMADVSISKHTKSLVAEGYIQILPPKVNVRDGGSLGYLWIAADD